MKKPALYICGLAIGLVVIFVIAGTLTNKAQLTSDIAVQLSSCLGYVESSTSAQLGRLYEQAKVPMYSTIGQNNLLLAVNSRIDSETACYSRYKPISSIDANEPLFKECRKTNNDYYDQYVNLATAQSVLDPRSFPQSSEFAVYFTQSRERAVKNCSDNYPVF